MKKNINILITGANATGKSYIRHKLTKFLKNEGINITFIPDRDYIAEFELDDYIENLEIRFKDKALFIESLNISIHEINTR